MKKVLIGSGGHAKEVMVQMGVKLLTFVDDEYVNADTIPMSKFDPEKYVAMVAVGNSKHRNEIVKKLPINTQFFTFIHPSSLIFGEVEIGEGSFIGANTILTTNIKIGKHAILNRGNHIGHDCQIGDYFSAMPGAIVSGNVQIGDRVYLGTNSSIKEKLKRCDDVILGLNSGVINNINESGTYVGLPIKKIK
jgi:sugar O-acyltransferase (sialic acid O-acetyltransferase NeuD family)